MKRLLSLCALLLATSCHRAGSEALADAGASSTTSASVPTGPMSATATGEPYGLRVEGDAVSFCDARGGRRLEGVGKDVALTRPCARDGESNITCDTKGLDVEVSTPHGGPNDLVDVNGNRFPLQGRVHDCAADAKTLAIVTGSTVVLIDTATGKTETVDRAGGDRVAIGKGWIAWSQGSTVHARHR
jgi:hypothetical protein